MNTGILVIALALAAIGAHAGGPKYVVLEPTGILTATAATPLTRQTAEFLRKTTPVILIGAPGDGQRALAQVLARDLKAELYRLDVRALLAHAPYQSDLADRLKITLAEFTGNPRRLLFIENLGELLSVSELATHLDGLIDRVQVVAGLTPSQFSGFVVAYPALLERASLVDTPRSTH